VIRGMANWDAQSQHLRESRGEGVEATAHWTVVALDRHTIYRPVSRECLADPSPIYMPPPQV